jgi:single-stranded-DNA-specific exonuclease
MKWQLQSDRVAKSQSELISILLENRGIEAEDNFFRPQSPMSFSLEELGFDLKEVEKTIKRIKEAIEKQEKVVIFADYDSDGINASTILYEALKVLGLEAVVFIPNRLKHGYGLSIKALQDLFKQEQQIDLIITVDNGIVAHPAMEFLEEKEIDVIITDHHQKDGVKLKAISIFHSTKICGAAVAWFLAREILGSENKAVLENLLELAAIATVTDLMPLLSYNRSILYFGLRSLKKTQRIGLQELMKVAKIDNNRLTSFSLGFGIGPRINATGRLAEGIEAFKLLSSDNREDAEQKAIEIDQLNANRKNMTFDLVDQAKIDLDQTKDERIIIIDSLEYHEGIIGLIAGRLTEEYSKPSIVLSRGEKISKASARSLAGFNITEFIRQFKDDLIDVGGHPLAAGFSMETKNLDKVKKAMFALAAKELEGVNLEPTLEADCLLPASLLNLSVAKELEKFAPFGFGNSKAIFQVNQLKIKNYKLMGAKQDHLKLFVTVDGSEQEYQLIAWGGAGFLEEVKIGDTCQALVNLGINNWRNRENLQLILKDIKKATD